MVLRRRSRGSANSSPLMNWLETSPGSTKSAGESRPLMVIPLSSWQNSSPCPDGKGLFFCELGTRGGWWDGEDVRVTGLGCFCAVGAKRGQPVSALAA